MKQIQFSLHIPGKRVRYIADELEEFVEAIWWDASDLLHGMIQTEKKEKILQFAKNFSQATIEFFEIEDRDWLLENQQGLPPLKIDPFFIYGPHFQGDFPPDLTNICIDSPHAFGSGHHPTTLSCLKAMIELSKEVQMNSILDLGCGSGLLAIAAAYLWNGKVVAVDCDPKSVDSAKKNIEKNKLEICVYKSEGFQHKKFQSHAPFSLIAANIHLKGLLDISHQVKSFLDQTGYLILSGILQSQQDTLIEAYTQQGFALSLLINKEDWTTAVFQKTRVMKNS